MTVVRLITLMVVTAVFSGCRLGCLMKRESECDCPTDIRQTVPWCAGEDAIFHCPCRPAYDYYGYKPTCWGVWPTSGADWRDSYCCSPLAVEYEGEVIGPGTEFPTPAERQENGAEAPESLGSEQLPPTSDYRGRRLPSHTPVPQQPSGAFRTIGTSNPTPPAAGHLPPNPFREPAGNE